MSDNAVSASRDRSSALGFTLLELLVSMAILGIVLPGVLFAFTTSSRSRAASEGETTAAFLALDRMAELEAQGVPEPGQSEGEFETGARYRWRVDVMPAELDGLYDVTVWVFWMEAGQERQLALRTYLADPSTTPTQSPLGAALGGTP